MKMLILRFLFINETGTAGVYFWPQGRLHVYTHRDTHLKLQLSR